MANHCILGQPRGLTIALVMISIAGVALLTADVYMFKHRREGYAYRITPYETVYHPLEFPSVQDVRADGVNLELRLAPGTDAAWRLVPEGKARAQTVGDLLRLSPPYGFGTYRWQHPGVEPANAPRLLTLRDPSSQLLGSPLIRIDSAPRHPLRRMVLDPEDFPEAHIKSARKLLAPLALHNARDTEERFFRVWQFVHREIAKHRGPPAEGVNARPAWEQYQLMASGKTAVYCANISAILALFATAAGVSVRIVDAEGDHGSVQLTSHAFVETFLPERQRFAYSDPTSSIAMLRAGPGGPPLNAVQVVELLRGGLNSVMWATVPGGDQLVEKPLSEVEDDVGRFLNHHAFFRFQLDAPDRFAITQRLIRYAWPREPTYAWGRTNTLHYVKLATLIATGLTIAAWFWLAIGWLRRLRPARAI